MLKGCYKTRSCGNTVSVMAVTFAFNCWEVIWLCFQMNTVKCTKTGSSQRDDGEREQQLQLLMHWLDLCDCRPWTSLPSYSPHGLSSLILFLYGLQYAFFWQHFVSPTHHTNSFIFLPHINYPLGDILSCYFKAGSFHWPFTPLNPTQFFQH